MLADKDVTVKQASTKVDKWVDKMIILARAAKKRVADRKAGVESTGAAEPKTSLNEVAKEAVAAQKDN